jgi:hypothetical protein
MRIIALTITTLVVIATPLRAQFPSDTVRMLLDVAKEAQRIGSEHGPEIFPGFRPDTIPMSFILPSRGDLLVGWRGPLPPGYVTIPSANDAAWRDLRSLSAASTSVDLLGRRIAQVSIGALDPAELAATAVHEAFHVFEAASRKQGRKFGAGENSILISTYPVFDQRNETAFALEGKLLAAALSARAKKEKRDLAREFVAVRRKRHRNLPPQFGEFDVMSEMNEGLAEYALVRTLQFIAKEGPAAWRGAARQHLESRMSLLDKLTATENLSLRFRFYQTGPAQALLLDALSEGDWKSAMLQRDATLQDMLALASGVDAIATEALARAERKASSLEGEVTGQIERLKRARRVKADSVLALPGMKLVLIADSLPGGRFNACGYDPQNLLQVSGTEQIHMRWWRPCAGGPTNAEFNVPSVHDEANGRVSAVIGNERDIKLTSAGQPVIVREGETIRDLKSFKLEAPRATVDAARADVTRTGNTLEIRPKRSI